MVDSIEGQQASTESFSYDALNRVTRIDQFGTGVVDKRVDFDYDAASQLRSLTRYGDLAGTNLVASTALTFDLDGRLSSLNHSNATEVLAGYQFSYDAADRLTEFNSLADGVSTYDYNDRNELTSSDHSYQDNEAYSYDDSGNRTNDGYTTGLNNLLLTDGQFNYSYDDEGNRTQRTDIATGEVTDYEWDHRNRLVGVETRSSSGELLSSAEYTYDAYNRRIAKTVDSDGDGSGIAQTERFVYDGTHIALVFDGAGDLQQRFLHGPGIDQVLAQEEVPGGEVLWALTDHQGTVRDVVDNAGQVVNHLVYDSFGNITSETNPDVDFRFSYTGREFDEETGQYYYRARYYDATVGQFINEDTIGFAGGDANLNRYVGNSPTNYIDPSGNIWEQLGQVGRAAWNGGIEGAKSGGGTGGASGFIAGAVDGVFNSKPVQRVADTVKYGTKGTIDFYRNRDDVNGATSNIIPQTADTISQTTSDVKEATTWTAEQAVDSYVETYNDPNSNPVERGAARAGGVMASLATGENFDKTKTVLELGLLADALIQLGLATPEILRRLSASGKTIGEVSKTLTDDLVRFVTNGPSSGAERSFLGSSQGHQFAGGVTRGGTGTAFAGHGRYIAGSGQVTVPAGTKVTLPRDGINILDETGRYIEAGDWDGLARAAANNPRIARDIEGMASWLPGSKVPNYTLSAPSNPPLNILQNSTTVDNLTSLDQLLQPNMGCIQWAACTQFIPR